MSICTPRRTIKAGRYQGDCGWYLGNGACGQAVFDGGSISFMNRSSVGDGVCHSVGCRGMQWGEGSCVGYDACYAAKRDSVFVGDVMGFCGNKAMACGYAAAYGGSFGNVSASCLIFQTGGMLVQG